MGILASNIADLVLECQELLIERGAFVGLQTDLQDFVAVREMWQGRQKKFQGGLDWRFDLQVDHNHSARWVALYETDGGAINDTLRKGTVGPRFGNAHYLFDDREPDLQRGEVGIVDLVKTKYIAMMYSWYETLEGAMWGKPADSTDEQTPYGIEYWILKNAAAGFNAENPVGFAAGRANIDSTAAGNARWANYADRYVAVSKEDLVRKMRRAALLTRFRSPLSHREPRLGGMKNGIYTTSTVIQTLEELLEAQNMNLGNDIASKDGQAMFKGTPVMWAPYLDLDAQNPVYMIDWEWFAIGTQPGWENKLGKPYPLNGQAHNVHRVDFDVTLNTVCTNLRRQAVLATA